MSPTHVLRLADYRDRRRQRLHLAESLYGADPGRRALLGHLGEVARVTGADRVATLWVDEYGAGLVHPHVVLDLLSDRPRRAFAAEPLRRAWESGVPGVHEASEGRASSAAPIGMAPAWSVSVALGSDGTRAWFLVADSVNARGPLDAALRDRLMFLAGECSAVVLHRDLDAMTAVRADLKDRSPARFAGWHILQDLEGREDDEVASTVISLRFVVGRLPRMLVEDDLTLPPDRRADQVQRAREEIRGQLGGVELGQEGACWERVLDAYEGGDFEALGRSLVEMGRHAEAANHMLGAADLYRTAFEISAADGAVSDAVEAARFAARASRRGGSWDQAHRWYGVARAVAEAAGMPDRVALVLDGVATTQRERGNLPAARETLSEGLRWARKSGEAAAVGRVYHGLMGLEQASGDLTAAMRYGWLAVTNYTDDDDRTRGFAGLAAVLQAAEEWTASEDAWRLVAHLTNDDYYRLYALDALSQIAAQRGDAASYARWATEVDALGWEQGPQGAKAELMLYRGVSCAVLGLSDDARRWLDCAVGFAEANGFSQILFRAEEELGKLDRTVVYAEPARTAPVRRGTGAPEEIRSELKALRLELVGS